MHARLAKLKNPLARCWWRTLEKYKRAQRAELLPKNAVAAAKKRRRKEAVRPGQRAQLVGKTLGASCCCCCCHRCPLARASARRRELLLQRLFHLYRCINVFLDAISARVNVQTAIRSTFFPSYGAKTRHLLFQVDIIFYSILDYTKTYLCPQGVSGSPTQPQIHLLANNMRIQRKIGIAVNIHKPFWSVYRSIWRC